MAVLFLLAMPAPHAAPEQQGERVLELPSTGAALDVSLARGETHDWGFQLAAADYLEVSIEPLAMAETDEWPLVTATAPDGHVVLEKTEPSISPSIAGWSRMVVSFVADQAGPYRIRVVARAAATRYLCRTERRHRATDHDRQRLDAHRLWEEALRLARGTRDTARTSLDKLEEARKLFAAIDDDEGEALTLGTVAAVWYELSNAKEGLAAAGRALDLWRRLGREREQGIAASDLGLLAYLGYDHASARKHYDEALVLHRAAGDASGEATTLTRIGWTEYAAAELQKVIDINHQALPLYRQVGEPRGESIAFNDLGRAYLDLGEVSQALDSFERALALRPADRYPRGAANVLIRLGLVYLAVAEWQRALDALQQALVLAQKGKDIRTETATLVNLGSAYVTMGDTGEGVRHLESALALARSIEFRGGEGNALLWLGVGASANGELARSRDYLQQALAIHSSTKDVRSQATTLRQLAAVQLELGQPHEALASITKSIEISPQASGLIYTGTLTLANIQAALGEAVKAQSSYEEAIGRFREVRARHAEALALTHFGRFQAQRGEYIAARKLLGEALAIQESLRGLIVDPDLRMSYTSASFRPYQLYTDVLMELERRSPGEGYAAEAFHTTERARARGLLDMLATSGVDIREGIDRALVERERSLRWNLNAKAALQSAQLAGKRSPRRLQALEREIAELSSALRETTTRIRQESPAYAALSEPQPATAAEVAQLLDSRTVLLEFALGETQSWLFTITNRGLESFALAPRRGIEDAAREVHRLLTARQPVPGEAGADRQARLGRADRELGRRLRSLSDMIFGHVAGKLTNEWRGRRLVVVADGALEYVPFAVLPLPGGEGRGVPLVVRHEIATLPSASTLALLRSERSRRKPPTKTIAVLADPVFAADDPRVNSRTVADPVQHTAAAAIARGGEPEPADDAVATRAFDPFLEGGTRASLARLPFSRMEASAVAAQVPRSASLHATDFEATLALATSGRLAEYGIVHFATHGFINTTRPELSGLVLSLVDPNGRRRDGFLRLNTIYNLRLAADLVVLSACQTALGKEVAGEGLVGLTRGFMYAGARRVIASLWQVNDVATAELMTRLYDGMLRRHLSPAAALRSAQLEMAKDPRWASPYFWAGFVVQGDWGEPALPR